MSTASQTPAAIILAQLGGSGRLGAMIGARNFLYSEKDPTWLSFKFKGCRKVNHLKVTLDASDTYTLRFGKIHGYNFREVHEVSGVYADKLRTIIEAQTGLYLSL